MPRRNREGGERGRPRSADPAHEQLLDRFEQEILQADPATIVALSESIWQHRAGVPEILTRRILEGRTRLPGLALDLLVELAGPRARRYLRRVAEDQGVPDIVRFGAQRRAGWPQRGAARRRLAFLDSLENPEQTLILAIDQGMSSWPPQCEILGEVLGYLAVVPTTRGEKFLRLAVDQIGDRAAWLLHALIELKDVDLARDAIRRVEQLRDIAAIPPLRRLARSTGVAELQADATATANRLARLADHSGVRTRPQALPPANRVLLSVVDGAGAQTILVTRSLGEQVELLVNYLTTDSWGIKDVFGQDRIPEVEVSPIIEEFASSGVYLVEVSLAACRGLMESAVDVNRSNGKEIPLAFELWEPFLHESYPPAADEAVVVPELDDTAYAGQTELLRTNGDLCAHRFFESWAFAPDEIGLAIIMTPPPVSPRRREEGLGPLIANALQPYTRARYRQRLRRQAWLLNHIGDTQARDLALATAASLIDGSPEELGKQPFFQEMASRGFEDVLANLYSGFGGISPR